METPIDIHCRPFCACARGRVYRIFKFVINSAEPPKRDLAFVCLALDARFTLQPAATWN